MVQKNTTDQKTATINTLFRDSAARNAAKPALSVKRDKAWHSLTYAEVGDRVRRFSLGLRALGIERGDRVAILSENRPEWAIADLAVLASGAVTVPIYSTLPPAQVAHILSDSGAKAIFASDAKQLNKAELSRERCPNLSIFITADDSTAKGDVLSFDAVLKEGDAHATPAESFETRRDSVRPCDIASLVYTSGTTGDPKGAELMHSNLAAGALMAEEWFPVDGNDTFLSFLPLCHVFERVTYYLALAMGSNTYYAESIFKVQENLADAHPNIMQSVPRLFETIHERIMDAAAKQPAQRQKMFHWALKIGEQRATRLNSGKFIGPILAAQYALADNLVLSKIRERLGGKLRFFVSGGAPLSNKTANFFHAINIPVLEGYGLTESTAALTCNPYHRARVGTVGKAFPGVTLKIAQDGEILAKGPNIMRGYWGRPGATHEMIDDDHWLHTGDIGVIDKDGYLKITDRKKDIIVLANGKNVAPQPIENLLKQSPLIAEIVLLGDKSGTVSALVIPNYEKLGAWAKGEKIAFKETKELAGRTDARKYVKSEIDKLSGDLAEFEKIRKIAILEQPLTIENGELTPTLKVRRKFVFEKYGHLLD